MSGNGRWCASPLMRGLDYPKSARFRPAHDGRPSGQSTTYRLGFGLRSALEQDTGYLATAFAPVARA